MLVGCAGRPWSVRDVEAEEGVLTLDLGDYPALARPGGMVAVQPEQMRKPILVMRVEGDAFTVLSLKCPHLGCTVRWDPEALNLVCPCHGSRFTDDGTVEKGPADADLQRYESQLQGTRLYVRVG